MSTVTLWELLSDNTIVIPSIQRDYAQGRVGKEYIRKLFLNEIKEHLESKKTLTLDFVYGVLDDGKFQPLDGQQRLTTLWLLHWFVALKSGKLNEDKSDKNIKKTLKNFSYATRIISRDFCEALCNKMGKYSEKDGNVADFIINQPWFYSSWKQDPTISSMLRTIGGERRSGSEQTEDNIEAVFKGIDFEEYWELLTGTKKYISFELMNIGTEKLPFSDDLYIKMNARGKPLTDFENMKADLVSWIQRTENSPDIRQYNRESTNKDSLFFANQIDNSWTDVFWNSAMNDYEKCGKIDNFSGDIDVAYYMFINRFVLNEICLKKINGDYIPVSVLDPKTNENYQDEKKQFDKLNGKSPTSRNTDDTTVLYEGFNIYEEYLTIEKLYELDAILTALSDNGIKAAIDNNLAKIRFSDENIEADKEERKYSFIPHFSFEKNSKKVLLAQTKQKERVYFSAICLFLKQNKESFDESKLKDWIRVVHNITENAEIDSITDMVNCIRLINDLGNSCLLNGWNVIDALLEFPSADLNETYLKNQLIEEQEKAAYLKNNYDSLKLVEEAERHPIFNGSIRFLYKGEHSEPNWAQFAKKWETAKRLFPESEGNVVSHSTIEKYLSLFKDFEEIDGKCLFTKFGYERRKPSWKKSILWDCKQSAYVHRLFMDENGSEQLRRYRTFLNSDWVRRICEKDEPFKYRYEDRYGYIHKRNSQSEGIYVKFFEKNVDIPIWGIKLHETWSPYIEEEMVKNK